MFMRCVCVRARVQCFKGVQQKSLEIEHKVSLKHIPMVFYDNEQEILMCFFHLITPGFVKKAGTDERAVYLNIT